MLHYLLTRDRRENQFVLGSELNDTGHKDFSWKLWAMSKTWKIVQNKLWKSFCDYQGGSAKPGGELRTEEHSFDAY